MKKVLALVLALIMVCTMAMAVDVTGGDTSSKSGNAKGYGIIAIGDNTNTATKTDAGTLAITTTTPKVTKDGDTTTTQYKAVEYKFADTTKFDGTYYAVDSSAAEFKLVKDNKIVAFLTDGAVATTTDVVSKVVKHAVNTVLKCGDYKLDAKMATGTMKVATATTLYTIGDKVYNGENGNKWAVLNGAFVKYTDTEADLVEHDFVAADTNVKEGVVTSAYCKNCKAYIPVVLTDDIPVTTLDRYEEVDVLDGYSYLVKAVSTAAATTNPDTGANDVIGVAAALAVVALVSGAAISLKK